MNKGSQVLANNQENLTTFLASNPASPRFYWPHNLTKQIAPSLKDYF